MLLGLAASGCATLSRVDPPWAAVRPALFRGAQTNFGAEPYSSWFGDTDGRILYFGLSAFWETSLQCGAETNSYCPLSDLKEPGDHLIGRFDMVDERFLAPLVVRRADPAAPSSVWDVLVHSNGRIYYTTFWDEFGSVLPDGGDVQHYAGAGVGLNELWEGPEGEIYATRYLGDRPGIAVFGPDGVLRRELPLPQDAGALICPKSLAVDPNTRDIVFNSDIFYTDNRPPGHDAFRMSPDGEIIERTAYPILAFLSFDRAGRGWFVDDYGERNVLRIVTPSGDSTSHDLGAHDPLDLVQDIKHAGDITLITSWGMRVSVVRERAGKGFAVSTLTPERPNNCPRDFALGYTAVLSPHRDVYETVSCRITVLRAGNADAGRSLPAN